MAIDAVTGANANLQAGGLSMESFIRILMTQLTYQDPLKPMDNQQFMAQMAQFTTLEQTQQLNSKIEQLVSNQAALQSVGLIGRTLDVNYGGQTQTGAVSALSLSGQAPVLTLTRSDGGVLENVGLNQIISIR
jgi:flagellar basal-body rod modification protein FlgD